MTSKNQTRAATKTCTGHHRSEDKMRRDYITAECNDWMLRDAWQPTAAELEAMRGTFGQGAK